MRKLGGYGTAELLRELEAEMLEAAENLQFEKAAILRDQIDDLKKGELGADTKATATPVRREVKYDRKLKVNVVKKARKPKSVSPS